MKRTYRNSRVLKRFTISHILVFACPLLVYLFMVAASVQSIDEKLYAIHAQKLRTVADTLDAKNAVKDIVDNLQFNTGLLMLLRNDRGTGPDMLMRRELSESLTLCFPVDSIIGAFDIYCVNQAYAIGPNYVASIDAYSKSHLYAHGVMPGDLSAFLSSRHRYEYHFFPQDDGTVVPVYISSLPYSGQSVLGNFVFVYDQNQIIRSLQTLSWDEGVVLRMESRDGQVIAASAEAAHWSADAETLQTRDTEYLVLRYQNAGQPFVYTAFIPVSLFHAGTNALRRTAFLSFVLCLIAELFLIYHLVRHNYKPLSDILGTVGQRRPLPEYLDEYAYLHDAFSQSLRDNENLEKQLRDNQYAMQNHILLDMILSSYTDRTIDSVVLSKNGIAFQGTAFALAYLVIEDGGELLGENLTEEKAFLFLTKTILGDVLEGVEHYVVSSSNGYYCLLCLRELHMELKPRFEQYINTLSQRMQICCTVYLSGSVSAPEDIHTLYIQCLSLHDNNDPLCASGGVFLYNETPKILYESIYPLLPRALFQQILDLMNHDQMDEAAACFNQFLGKAPTVPLLAVRYLASLCAYLLMEGAKHRACLCTSHAEIPSLIANLVECSTLHEIRDTVNTLFDHLSDTIETPASTGVTMAEITHFIHQNLLNSDINVTYIADHFQLSQTNLSRIFKRQTGIGLLDYLNHMRVDRAKGLLAASAQPIGKLAEAMGFNSASHFIRVFKKYVGISPTQYRREIQRKPSVPFHSESQ